MFSGILVPFKKFICTFNVLTKFATMRRRPSEATVLFQLIGSKHGKAVGEVWPETRCRDYRSQSESYRASPTLRDKRAWQPGNVAKSECLFYWDWGHSAFLFELPLTCWSNRTVGAECGQVNQHQHVFAAQSACAKTFKSNVGSGDSALGISPILRLRFIMQNASLLALHICDTTHFTD